MSTCRSANPGLWLDFYRFASDSYAVYQKMQIDILRQQCPKHWITHNLMGFKYDKLNYFDMAKDLDFVSWDNYPRTQWKMDAEVDPSRAAIATDTMRGLKRKNVWVMEQQGGPGGWEIVSVAPRPGELRLWAYQSIAHGADAIVFFRWRTARFGTEQYWHGLLDHDARPSRRYQEIKRMGLEMRKIGAQIEATEPQPRVAMLLSYDSRFAFQVQANNPRFSYFWHFHELYQAFHRRNIPVDIVDPLSDLSVYRLVIAPALHVLSEAAAENLRRFVAGGGVTVITPRSGVKDEANRVVNQRLPGLLADLCGVQVEEYDSLPLEGANELEFCLPELADLPPIRCEIWCDVLAPVGAEVAARYCQDY
jgi:beta-galactosidase